MTKNGLWTCLFVAFFSCAGAQRTFGDTQGSNNPYDTQSIFAALAAMPRLPTSLKIVFPTNHMEFCFAISNNTTQIVRLENLGYDGNSLLWRWMMPDGKMSRRCVPGTTTSVTRIWPLLPESGETIQSLCCWVERMPLLPCEYSDESYSTIHKTQRFFIREQHFLSPFIALNPLLSGPPTAATHRR